MNNNPKCGRNCELCQEMHNGYCIGRGIGNDFPCQTCNIPTCCESHHFYSCKDCPGHSGCPSVQKIAAEESLLISRVANMKKAGKVLRVLFWFSIATTILSVLLAVFYTFLKTVIGKTSYTNLNWDALYGLVNSINVLAYILLALTIGETICYLLLVPYSGFYKGAAVVHLISTAVSFLAILGNIDSKFLSDLTDVGAIVSMVLFWIGNSKLTDSVFPDLSSRWKNMWKEWLIPIVVFLASTFTVALMPIFPLFALLGLLGLLVSIVWIVVVCVRYVRLLYFTGRSLSGLAFETSWFFSEK